MIALEKINIVYLGKGSDQQEGKYGFHVKITVLLLPVKDT